MMNRISLLLMIVMVATEPSLYSQERSQTLLQLEEYINNILVLAQDSYSGQQSPLLANGINTQDGSPLLWKNGDGTTNVLSNFSGQQNFLRLLVGLSNLTGNPLYRDRAEAMVRYYFEHYQEPVGGLLYWGGHRFIDLKSLEPVGVGDKNLVHELKNGYPYYDFMYDIDELAATKLIEGIWNAHVLNWSEMETSRHGLYGEKQGILWDHSRKQLEPWYETKGLSFLNAGNDLIYSASVLARRTNEPKALAWAEHLSYQYVYPRNKSTGLGVYQFTKPLKTDSTNDDANTLSWYGDRAARQFGPEFGEHALEGNMMLAGRTSTIYSENALMQLQLALELGDQGANFHQWTIEGLTSFAEYAFDKETQMFRPMITDGQDLSNYSLPRDGYYGKKGTVLQQYKADGKFMLSFSRAYLLQPNDKMWSAIAGIAEKEGLGKVGTTAGQSMELNYQTTNRDPYMVFSLIDLFNASNNQDYLSLAQVVAQNISDYHYRNKLFINDPQSQWANIDTIYPYALLSLEAALLGLQEMVAPFINGAGFTEGAYLLDNGDLRISTTDQHIFALKIGQSLSPSRHTAPAITPVSEIGGATPQTRNNQFLVSGGHYSSTGGTDKWKNNFTVTGGVDVRGWAGPQLKEDSVWGQFKPELDQRYAGVSINKGKATFIALDYNYGPFLGAVVQVGFEAGMNSFQHGRIEKTIIGPERIYGYVDILGMAQVDKYVGLRLSMGYLYFEPKTDRLTVATHAGGPALNFEMGTQKAQRGYLRDPLNIRVDMPINAIDPFDLIIGFATDLDFSSLGLGQTFLVETLFKNIKINKKIIAEMNLFYSNWRGNADFNGGRNYLNGEGNFGAWSTGGSAGVAINTVNKDKLHLAIAVDYEGYWGNFFQYRYVENFNIHETNGRVTTAGLYDTKKGNISGEIGISYDMVSYATISVAYINWVDNDRKYSFSTNESEKAARASSFLSTRIDFNMIRSKTALRPFVGFGIGIVDARPGYWSQGGRFGYEVGLQYQPHRNLNLRTGWHAGSNLIGHVYAPGTLTKRGQYYIRAKWDLR